MVVFKPKAKYEEKLWSCCGLLSFLLGRGWSLEESMVKSDD
jgi:hypothetical protein